MLPLRMLVALMLTFLLRDADSIPCPAEDDILTLDPPEIIGKYQESFYVNCTNIDENHYGMKWNAGGKESEEETEKSFVEWDIILSDWDLKAECSIMPNDSFECTKELPITVYQNPEMVNISKHVGIEGTPYELQCDILNVAPVQKLTVSWYKDNQIIKTDTFNNTAKTPVNQTSTLTVNINRTEHGAQFKCEARLNLTVEPQTPVMSDVHHLSVHYAPELLLSKTHTLYVNVNENDDVTLNCEAEANPPPVFTWTSDGRNISENTKNLTITQVNTSGTYFCTASNYLGNITQEIIVSVQSTYMAATAAAVTTPKAATKKGCSLTLMPAEVVVKFGDPVSVNCSSSEPNEIMGWEAAVAPINMESVSSVTWTVDKLEMWTITPVCYANIENELYVSQCTVKPDITLYKTPDAVIVSPLTYGPIQEGTEFQLNCDIINVAPVKNLVVKWYRGNEMVQTQSYNGSTLFPVDETSTFKDTAKRDHNGAHFRCVAELHLGPNGPEHPPSVSSVNYTTDVRYKPRMQNCADHHTAVEPNFSLRNLSCKPDGNPPPDVKWYYQGKLINEDEPLNRTQSGEYTVELLSVLGGSTTSVNITVEYSPSFSCDSRYEVQEGGKVQIKCDPKGKPEPDITWYKDRKQIETPQRWTKHDSGFYTRKATNKHGTADHRLYLDVQYAPVFAKGNDTKEVTVGENVTLECHAEGNPAPEIHWNFTSAGNVRETTGGRQKNTVIVSIRGATSTNTGVYICVATNKIGSVRRSVTLMMKGKSAGFPMAVIWLLLIILGSIILIAFIIYFLKRSQRHGQYSFVPNKTDDSAIPMTANGVRA